MKTECDLAMQALWDSIPFDVALGESIACADSVRRLKIIRAIYHGREAVEYPEINSVKYGSGLPIQIIGGFLSARRDASRLGGENDGQRVAILTLAYYIVLRLGNITASVTRA